MDYKNKYNDALKKLQEALAPKDGCEISGLTRGCIEEIFPELKESEDEKIKKEIIATIHLYYGEPLEDEAKEMISWLEKQEEKLQGKTALEAIKEEKVDNANKIEQSSAWNEEDEKNLTRAIWYIENPALNVVKDTMLSEWLKSIKGRVQPQPKQEWSEEDEKIALSIEQVMNCASLLNLVPEKIEKVRAWLKSLKERCTWKPSNIQMECLHDAVEHYHTNGYPASKLNELYEQMSKIYKL